jgi:hypothetical protein
MVKRNATARRGNFVLLYCKSNPSLNIYLYLCRKNVLCIMHMDVLKKKKRRRRRRRKKKKSNPYFKLWMNNIYI